MDNASPSNLSLLAAGLYVMVALACSMAARSNASHSQDRRFWVAMAIAFIAFAVLRLLSAEDFARDLLRDLVVREGLRDVRRSVQATLVVVTCIIASGIFAWFAANLRKSWNDWNARMRWIASIALAVLVALIAVRIVSLHFTDALLFRGLIGPIRLNWIVDLGASATVILCALLCLAGRSSADKPVRRSVSDYRR